MPPNDSPETTLDLVHRGWEHLRLQRPLAAWASWQQALRLAPDDPAATEALAILESAGDLPLAARIAYRFRPPEASRRSAWSSRFESRDLRDLSVAANTFAELADADPDDASAAFNQALCLAWLGENEEAIAALDRSVRRDADSSPEDAIASWRIAEILRQGAGAEAWADDLSASMSVAWPEAEGDALEFLEVVAYELRPIPVPVNPVTGKPPLSARVAEWLDRWTPNGEDIHSASDLPRVLATVLASPGSLRFSSPDRRSLEVAEAAYLAVRPEPEAAIDRRSSPLPLRLMDASVWTFRLPDELDAEVAIGLRRSAIERYFEHDWITRPRLGLAAADEPGLPATPIDASRRASRGDAIALAKLNAVVDVREQLTARPGVSALYAGYPFDRLRRRLGLSPNNPAAFDAEDVTCMSAGELERLDPSKLDDSALSEAVEAARLVCDASIFSRFQSEADARPIRGEGTAR